MQGGPRPEELRALVSRHFTVVGLHYDEHSVFLPIALRPVDDDFERSFDLLRRELVPRGFIPMLIRDQGELGIYIARKPPARYRSTTVNLVMLLVTICTTVFAGTVAWAPYEDLELFSSRSLLFGSVFFALPLMLILGVHELSHYIAARRHGVAASLPFFLPAFPPLGTFGAFISMRDPIPNRKALLDIGVSGPIAGFIMAIAVTFLGVWLTDLFAIPVPADTGGLLYLGSPLLFEWIWQAVGAGGNYLMHPTAFAGWVGFLVTALNLLPAGQLDGGHIARAVLGERSRYAGYAAVVALGILSMVSFDINWSSGQIAIGPGYLGWFVFIFLILFLGLYHPPPLNDLTRLDRRRKGLGLLAAVILCVAFVPVPMVQGTPEYDLRLVAEETTGNVEPNASVNYTFFIENTGNVGSDMLVNATFADRSSADGGWRLNLSRSKLFVPAAGYREVNLTVRAPEAVQPGARASAVLKVWPADAAGKRRTLEFNTTVGYLRLIADPLSMPAIPSGPGHLPRASFNITLQSLQDVNRSVVYNLSIAGNASWYDWPPGNLSLPLAYLQNLTFWFNVSPPLSVPPTTRASFVVEAEEALNSSRRASVSLLVEMPAVHVLTIRPLPPNATSPAIGRGETAAVQVIADYTGNFGDSFAIEVRSSTGLEVATAPGPLEFLETSTRSLLFSLTVAPDAPSGILTATVGFRSAYDQIVQAELLFSVTVG